MDVSSVAAGSGITALRKGTEASAQDIGVHVLKKANEIHKESALQLIESLPDPGNPVGQNINVKA